MQRVAGHTIMYRRAGNKLTTGVTWRGLEQADERVDYVESLIPGRSSVHTPVSEWLMVADFVS